MSLSQIKEQIDAFKLLQFEYMEYGASFPEQDDVFHHLLADALKGLNVAIPYDAAGWQLFRIDGADEAGQQLGSQAAKVVRLIQDKRLADADEVREYIEDYCWRVVR